MKKGVNGGRFIATPNGLDFGQSMMFLSCFDGSLVSAVSFVKLMFDVVFHCSTLHHLIARGTCFKTS